MVVGFKEVGHMLYIIDFLVIKTKKNINYFYLIVYNNNSFGIYKKIYVLNILWLIEANKIRNNNPIFSLIFLLGVSNFYFF
jgi:hypothetical protein